jgi:hypothetical protein
VNAALRAINATYNFFAGDLSILAGASAAFALTFLLVRYPYAPTALVAGIFVALLAARLADCLNCDVVGPSRQRRRPARRSWTVNWSRPVKGGPRGYNAHKQVKGRKSQGRRTSRS